MQNSVIIEKNLEDLNGTFKTLKKRITDYSYMITITNSDLLELKNSAFIKGMENGYIDNGYSRQYGNAIAMGKMSIHSHEYHDYIYLEDCYNLGYNIADNRY